MDVIGRFATYAAAFEKAVATREWDQLDEFFTENARYRVTGGPPLGGDWSGRHEIIDALRHSVDTLDRQFDERRLRGLAPPTSKGPVVTVHWGVTYRLEGAPELRFDGIERATFQGDRIEDLEDEIDPVTAQRIHDYAEEYLGGKSR
jgi:hypothetical protein